MDSNDNDMDIRRNLFRLIELTLNEINSEGYAFKEGAKVGEITGTGKILKEMRGFSKEEVKEYLQRRHYDPKLIESVVEENYDKWE